jgi:MarC family membrane protein
MTIEEKIGMDWTLISNFAAATIAIVNPLGNLPVFISLTASERKEVRRWLAVLVSGTVFVFLMVFLMAGEAILAFFGISLAAFRIAGGILLLLIGIDMIRGIQTKMTREAVTRAFTNNLKEAEFQYRQTIVPLGIPLFVGPGAISTVILYADRAQNGPTYLGLVGVIAAVSFLVMVCLLSSEGIKRAMGETGLAIATRILGVLLTAIGVQFMLGGLAEATLNFINPAVA